MQVVIDVGAKKKMGDWVQERGNGRQGLILSEMKNFIAADVCRRIVIGSQMDGKGDRLGCEVGEDTCDVWQGKARGQKRRRMILDDFG